MKKGNEIAWTTRCTKIKKAVFSDDHNSEGFLAPLSDGRIALFFRRDPGKEGSHVGTRGYIARAIYDPENDSWGGVEKIYDSGRFDDRNIHGGVTRSGRIVLFFRHLRGDRNTEGRFFMTSDDDGRTWSEPRTSEKLTGIPGTGQLF